MKDSGRENGKLNYFSRNLYRIQYHEKRGGGGAQFALLLRLLGLLVASTLIASRKDHYRAVSRPILCAGAL